MRDIPEVGKLRRIAVIGFVAVIILLICTAGFADGPAQSMDNKLFGVCPRSGGAVPGELVTAYEKSSVTAAFIDVSWQKCEASDPGNAPSRYDFSSFDSSPFAKSAKTRIAVISLGNSWAGKLDKERYWKLADSFFRAFIKHANDSGVKHFLYTIEQENPLSSVGPTASSIEPLRHLYKAAKEISKSNVVIAVCPYGSGANATEIAYGAGAKGSFDMLAVAIMPAVNRPSIDAYSIMEVHREMLRNGDGDKKILVIPSMEAVTNSQSYALGVEEVFRGLLTERDAYDPNWIAGAFATVSTDTLIQATGMLKVQLPKVSMDAALSSDTPVFNYVAGRTYKLALKVTNSTDQEMKLDAFSVILRGDKDYTVDAKPDGDAPASVPAGGEATANFSVVFPNNAAGKQVTLIGRTDYTLAGNKHVADAWLTVSVSSQLEITLLPARSIIDPASQDQKIGMSVINHSESEFSGKISLTSTPGISVTPADFDTKIDAQGLEAYVFSIAADKKAAPGHYAVYVNVDGQNCEWAAVDVPVIAAKLSTSPKIDGNLDDWANAAVVSIAKVTQTLDKKYLFEIIGKGRFAYDASNFYVAIETDHPEYADRSISLGFDPRMNGAKSSVGGFKDDDFELTISGGSDKSNIVVFNRPSELAKSVKAAAKKSGTQSVQEIAIPWSSLAPFSFGKDKTFAAAICIEDSAKTGVEWGGGLAGEKDPRKFVPIILADSL